MMVNWRINHASQISSLICTTAALAAAGAFVAVSFLSGNYTWVARIGGAGWTFLLSWIVLLPSVMPWLKKRLIAENADMGSATAGIHSAGEAVAIRLNRLPEGLAGERRQPIGYDLAQRDYVTPMAMAGLLWLCILVVILLVVLPIWGGWISLIAAGLVLVAMLAVCFAVCGLRRGTNGED